jgi:hypothetical protein
MGWGSTGGERAADTRAYDARQNRQHQAKMGDVAWKRKLIADYRARNDRHKHAAFEMEKQEAKRENRPPRIWSPEQVPDLPLPAELRPPAPPVNKPREPWRVEGFGPNDVKIFKMIGIAILLYMPFGITLQVVGGLPGIISIPIMVVVLVTEVWLVLRYRAKGDATKLERAEKWNPVKASKKSASWVREKTAKQPGVGKPVYQFTARRESDQTPAE